MEIKGKNIGFGITGSHCTFQEILPIIKDLVEHGANVIPIASNTVMNTDTRFGTAEDFIKKVEDITGNKIISSIVEAEPLGPNKLLDVMVIAPCTGNTLARLANAITDSPVLMAAKTQMRNQKPLVIAISTNDGLGLNAKNIATLLTMKNIYFVPFGQDSPDKKPNSLIAKMDLILPTCEFALNYRQIQPIIVEYK